MVKYSTEQLSKISNEDLEREFMSVRSAINSARRKKSESRDIEMYYCYVSREVQIREKVKGGTIQNRATPWKKCYNNNNNKN